MITFKKTYLKLASKDGKKINLKDEILIKQIDDKE